MSGAYLGLQASLWIYEVGSYLNITELLALRLLDKAANQFVLFVLFPQRGAMMSSRLEALKSVPKTDEFLQFQNLLLKRDAIMNSSTRSLAEVSSFPNPPNTVYTVCGLLARIVTGELGEIPWHRCSALFKSTRFWPMFIEKMYEEEVEVAWLSSLETSAAGISRAQAAASSKSCVDILTLVTFILNLRRAIVESPEVAKKVFAYERGVTNSAKELRTEKNVAKIAAGERMLGGWKGSWEETKTR